MIILFSLHYGGNAECGKDFIVSAKDRDGNLINGAFAFPTILLDESERMIVTVKALMNNNLVNSKKLKIIVSCTDINDNTKNYGEIEFQIPAVDSIVDASSEGDPHFGQIVLDKNSSIPYRICYDVTGKSGQNIHILSDHRTNTSIYGTLMDDYYIHSINVYSSFCKFNINTKHFKIENSQTFDWNINQKYLKIMNEKYKFEISQNIINIYIISNEFSLKLLIKRDRHTVSGSYLDINFPNIGMDYQEKDGLIGRIGKNNFIFYKLVQTDYNKNFQKRAVININGRRIKSLITERNKNICWLINVQDALSNIPLSNYIN